MHKNDPRLAACHLKVFHLGMSSVATSHCYLMNVVPKHWIIDRNTCQVMIANPPRKKVTELFALLPSPRECVDKLDVQEPSRLISLTEQTISLPQAPRSFSYSRTVYLPSTSCIFNTVKCSSAIALLISSTFKLLLIQTVRNYSTIASAGHT